MVTKPEQAASSSPGPSVDRQGTPVIDPTDNVIRNLEAAVKRLDDLRLAEKDYNAAEARHVREIAAIREGYIARIEVKERELRVAESARIDAIRAVDVGAVNRAAEVSAMQATTLAAQVATSAETLRTQVAAAAAAASTSLATALEPLNIAIADLRKAQYEAQGQKIQVTERRDSGGSLVAYVGLGVSLLLAVIVVVSFIIQMGG